MPAELDDRSSSRTEAVAEPILIHGARLGLLVTLPHSSREDAAYRVELKDLCTDASPRRRANEHALPKMPATIQLTFPGQPSGPLRCTASVTTGPCETVIAVLMEPVGEARPSR